MKKLNNKPTHHSVQELRALGLTPHFLACRSAQPLLENTKQKLPQFCHVPAATFLIYMMFQTFVMFLFYFGCVDVCIPLIIEIDIFLIISKFSHDQNAHEAILKQLALLRVARPPNLQEWTNRAETCDNLTNSVKIAMVGKYGSICFYMDFPLKSLIRCP
ncbi:unnamed protein product [Lactuca saligna]|uniref:CTP synthase N-terminal domain-containing protein n=1 Tax=Lactuca saligna TaxID=75948 RepID=A0AA35Z2A9_LACSI|nr:unnamed protein product [Lactuca saligna]